MEKEYIMRELGKGLYGICVSPGLERKQHV